MEKSKTICEADAHMEQSLNNCSTASHTERPKNRRRIGAHYERLAAQYLEAKGYQILEQNYRIRTGELDLIALDGRYLVFVEVKYRENTSLGDPFEAVDQRKQRKIYRTAQQYLLSHGYGMDAPCRFDVIGITGNQIRHLENAFWG